PCQRPDVHRVEWLTVSADAGEGHALDVAVDAEAVTPDQAPRYVRQDALDGPEDHRLVLPGPDDDREGLRTAYPYRHRRAGLTAEQPGHPFGQRNEVVLVVMPVGRHPRVGGPPCEVPVAVARPGAFPGEGAGKRWCAHG